MAASLVFKHKFNRLLLRERIIIFIGVAALLLAIWDLLLIGPINKLNRSLKEQATSLETKKHVYQQKLDKLNGQLRSSAAQKKLLTYKKLKEEIAEISRKSADYKQKTLSQKKIVEMLDSIFKKTNQLKLLEFMSVDMAKPKPSKAKQANKEKKDEKDKDAKKVEEAQKAQNHYLTKYYRINLSGDYFSLMRFLKAIEALPWQLYWDEMFYQVADYPTANVQITFHAMSKKDD